MNLSSFKGSEVKSHFKKTKLKYKKMGLEFFLAPSPFRDGADFSKINYGRILVVTPRKTGSSVERNLVRRRLKSIFREESYWLKNIDCLVIVRKEGVALSFDLLKNLMTDAFEEYQKKMVR